MSDKPTQPVEIRDSGDLAHALANAAFVFVLQEQPAGFLQWYTDIQTAAGIDDGTRKLIGGITAEELEPLMVQAAIYLNTGKAVHDQADTIAKTLMVMHQPSLFDPEESSPEHPIDTEASPDIP